MKIGLILSNDWELFGDGSGDYFEIQHQPLEALLQTAKDHGAKISVMAETAQQWAHLDLSNQYAWAKEISEAWISILQNTLRHGSDVQLNIHPQWLNAKYSDATNQWVLNSADVSIANRPQEELEKLLGKGKAYLESILKPVDSNYACSTFRAGAFAIEPYARYLKALRKTGFHFDSSIVPGLTLAPFFNFQQYPCGTSSWRIDDSILELPIHTIATWMPPILRRALPRSIFEAVAFGTKAQDYSWFETRDEFAIAKYPASKHTLMLQNTATFFDKFRSKVINRSKFILDYDFLSADVFVSILKRKLKEHNKDDGVLIVTALGHAKNVHNSDNLKRILGSINTQLKDRVSYLTYSDVNRMLPS